MPPSKDLRAQLATAQTELGELRGDLPKLELLLAKHEATAHEAVTAARKDPEHLEVLAEASRRRDAVRSMLEQHQAEITAAERQVSDLTRQLETENTVKRIRKLEAELERGRDDFATKALDVYNSFIAAAFNLRAERQRLVDADAEANRLRAQLQGDLLPADAKKLFDELGIPRALGLLHFPAKVYGLRLFAANANSPVKSRMVGILDQLLQDPSPALTAEALRLERKKAA